MKKGAFIVIDGNDGSGKATQTTLLVERLTKENIAAEKIDFPRYEQNFFGKLIGECLAGLHGDFIHLDPKIASSLYALDRFESSPSIRSALTEGKIVVADRFTSANQIHQGGKIRSEKERKDFLEWLDVLEHAQLKIPRPDILIYLHVPLEVSLELLSKKRAQKNPHATADKDVVEADREYLEHSNEAARWIAARESSWHSIECTNESGNMRTAATIHEDIWRLVRTALP